MLNTNVTLDHKPQRVKVEVLPEGVRRVALYDHIREEEIKDEGGTYTVWHADEVVFATAEALTVETVEASFARWWAYGAAEPRGVDTRVGELESALDDVYSALTELAEIVAGGEGNG